MGISAATPAGRPRALCAYARPHAREQRRAREVRRGIECDRPAGADRRDDDAADGGAEDAGCGLGEPKQGVCGLQLLGLDDVRRDALRRGKEERDRDPARHLQHDQLPQLSDTGE
jgi:hypothetical protein